ncbi:TY-Chap domain-containing protein [Nocardia sp. FBN12]|uniref:TY-Chap domain-containing protein n=1 Tax=Nocardia sp. FBN12 TaxID=3419766 RepID=UPI003D039089
MNATPLDADWQNFSAALALTLSSMPAKAYVVIKSSGGRYARFFVATPELWCEIVHDDELGADFQMSDRSRKELREQGWRPPVRGLSENWHLLLDWPVRYRVYENVAEQVVLALRQGLGVAGPTEFEIKSWIEDSDKEFPVSALIDASMGGASPSASN